MAPNQKVTLKLTTQVSNALPPGTSVTNCQVTTVGQSQGTATSPSVCSPTFVAQPPTTAGQVGKDIVPAIVTAPLPGLTPRAQVQLRAANTGNLPLSRIVIVDPDQTQDNPDAFFDNTDLVSVDAVNFPPGANRVQIDACLAAADCAAGIYTLGVPAAAPALPGGVAAGSVAGLRFTFTNSAGGFLLNPGTNFPKSGPCPGATVCFTVTPRSTLRTSGAPIAFPTSISNIVTAGGESPISQGQLASFGSAAGAARHHARHPAAPCGQVGVATERPPWHVDRLPAHHHQHRHRRHPRARSRPSRSRRAWSSTPASSAPAASPTPSRQACRRGGRRCPPPPSPSPPTR